MLFSSVTGCRHVESHLVTLRLAILAILLPKNALSMPEVRGEWLGWFEMTERPSLQPRYAEDHL